MPARNQYSTETNCAEQNRAGRMTNDDRMTIVAYRRVQRLATPILEVQECRRVRAPFMDRWIECASI